MTLPRARINGMVRLDAQLVVPYLLEARVLTPKEVVKDGLAVQDVSRRNMNFRVQIGRGGGYLVKQGGAGGHPLVVDRLEGEASILKLLNDASAYASMRDFCPRLAHRDQPNGILATELIHPGTSLTKYHLNGGRVQFPAEAGETVGGILGRFHRCGEDAARLGELPPAPWKLPVGLASLLATERAWKPNPTRVMFERATEGMGFMAAAKALARRWGERKELVHGDMRLDNFLLTSGEPVVGGLNLKLIDWELASPGHGTWDLACILTDYVRFWMTCAQMRNPTSPEDYTRVAPFQVEAIQGTTGAALAAYAQERGMNLGELMKEMESLVPIALGAQAWEYLSNSARNGTVTEMPMHAAAILSLVRQYEADPVHWNAVWFAGSVRG